MVTLTEALQSLDSVYREARKTMKAQWDELRKLDEQEQQTRADSRLTELGKHEALKAIESKRRAAQGAISVCRLDAARQMERTRQEQLELPSKWAVNPKHLDTEMKALIDSGILTDSELITLAGKARNVTMQRVFARELRKRADEAERTHRPDAERERLLSAANQLESIPNPIEKLFASYNTIYSAALRDDELYADSGASLYDAAFTEAMQTAENIDSTQFQ